MSGASRSQSLLLTSSPIGASQGLCGCRITVSLRPRTQRICVRKRTPLAGHGAPLLSSLRSHAHVTSYLFRDDVGLLMHLVCLVALPERL